MTTKSAALLLSEVLGLGHLAALEGIRDRTLLRRGFATGVSDYVVGSTENRISGSNPSFSATIFVVEITYEFAFLQVEFSPLSRGLRELNL